MGVGKRFDGYWNVQWGDWRWWILQGWILEIVGVKEKFVMVGGGCKKMMSTANLDFREKKAMKIDQGQNIGYIFLIGQKIILFTTPNQKRAH